MDDTKADLTGRPGQTASSVQATLEKHIPSPPFGQLLSPSGTGTDGQARIGFAVRSKVDDYGPGGQTVTFRMCVVVTMTPSPELTTSITDTDCTAVAPTSEAIVKFTT